MASLGSRRGFAENLALPLMILALLVVGGFLYWLNITAEPTEVEIVEAEEAGPETSAILGSQEFLGAPEQYVGQTVEVTGARVSSRLGAQAFWIGQDDDPFLVKMAPEVLEAGTEVLIEQRVDIVGRVMMMTDSALTVWDSLGAFPTEGDRIVAEFAVGNPVLEALRIAPVQTGGGGGGPGTND